MPATNRMQAVMPAQAMAVPKIGLEHDQTEYNHDGRNRGQDRVAPVVDGLGFVFEKPGQKQN